MRNLTFLRKIFVAVTFVTMLGVLETVLLEGRSVNENPRYVPNEVLVRFKPAQRDIALLLYLPRMGAHLRTRIPALGVDVVKSSTLSTSQLMDRLSQVPAVEYVEPNYVGEITLIPNDPQYGNQWHLPKIRMPEAWDVTTGDSSVVVAVLDTGVDLDEADVVPGKDTLGPPFTAGSVCSCDDNGHGTHTWGIVAAGTNNGVGVSGVGFNTKSLIIKVCDASGSCPTDAIANGITYAANNGADIISMSFGGPASATLRSAVEFSWNAGVLNVASSGNQGNGSNVPEYPAAYTDVVQPVGATDQNDARAYFSTFGNWVDLYAPGVDILSTCLEAPGAIVEEYCLASGTSMSAPQVAALAALVRARFSGSFPTPTNVREQMVCTGKTITVGGVQQKRLDAFLAVTTSNRACHSSCTATNTACEERCERYLPFASKYQVCVDGCAQDYATCNNACEIGVTGCSPF